MIPMRQRLVRQMLGGGVAPLVYLLRDEFATTEAAPMASPRTCEPGPGTLAKTDGSNNSSIIGKRLTYAGGGAKDPSWVFGSAVARAVGRMYYIRANVLYTGGFLTGISATQNGTSYTDRLYCRAGFTFSAANGGFPEVDVAGKPIRKGAPYFLVFVDTSLGRLYYIVGPDYPFPICVYYNRADASANVYLAHSNYLNGPSRVDEMAVVTPPVYPVPLVMDSFTRADGAVGNGWADGIGTGLVAANALAITPDAGAGAVWRAAGNAHHLTIAALTRSAGTVGVVVKWVDAANFLRVAHDGTNILIIQRVAGVESTLATTAGAYSAGKDLLVMCSGAVVRAWYNNAPAGTGAIPAALLASQSVGLWSSDASNKIDNFETYARGNAQEYGYFKAYLAGKAQNGRFVIFDGDSITLGSADATSYPYKAAYSYTPSLDSANLGIYGQTVAQMAANSGAKIDGLADYYPNSVVVLFGGTNDISAGATAAAVEGSIQTYCLARRAAGFRVMVLTILPRGSFGAGQEAIRVAVNAWLLANYASFADAAVNVAADGRLDDYNDTTYYNADKIHLTEAGSAVLAELVVAALNALA